MVTIQIADHDFWLLDTALRAQAEKMQEQADGCRVAATDERTEGGPEAPLIGSYEAVARVLQESADANNSLRKLLQAQYEEANDG